MSKDFDEMESMLNDYLQFAKSQAKEETSLIQLPVLIDEIKTNLNNENLIINNLDNIKLNGRANSLRRCFENVIQNGLTYGTKVYVDLHKSANRAIINIEDDGPVYLTNNTETYLSPF